jgi:hypothetical protein
LPLAGPNAMMLLVLVLLVLLVVLELLLVRLLVRLKLRRLVRLLVVLVLRLLVLRGLLLVVVLVINNNVPVGIDDRTRAHSPAGSLWLERQREGLPVPRQGRNSNRRHQPGRPQQLAGPNIDHGDLGQVRHQDSRGRQRQEDGNNSSPVPSRLLLSSLLLSS